MPSATNNIGTFTLTTSIQIIQDWGVRSISIKCTAGTVTFTGSMKLGSLASNALTVPVDGVVTISDNDAIDGLTIDATAGTALLITRM